MIDLCIIDYGEHENLRQVYTTLLQLKFGNEWKGKVSDADIGAKRKRVIRDSSS